MFIEVKTRRSRAFGEPWEFVDWQKQQILRRTAEDFIADHDMCQYSVSFRYCLCNWRNCHPIPQCILESVTAKRRPQQLNIYLCNLWLSFILGLVNILKPHC